MLNQIEQSIVDRLSPLRDSGLLVRALPNRSSEYGEVQGNGVLTVSWAADEVQLPDSVHLTYQKCLTVWAIDGRVRNLRSESGLQELRSAIYRLLIGFKPPHCDRMYARRFEFTDRTENYWRFEAMFVAPTVLLADIGVGTTEPLLSRLVFETDRLNGVVVPTPLVTTIE